MILHAQMRNPGEGNRETASVYSRHHKWHDHLPTMVRRTPTQSLVHPTGPDICACNILVDGIDRLFLGNLIHRHLSNIGFDMDQMSGWVRD